MPIPCPQETRENHGLQSRSNRSAFRRSFGKLAARSRLSSRTSCSPSGKFLSARKRESVSAQGYYGLWNRVRELATRTADFLRVKPRHPAHARTFRHQTPVWRGRPYFVRVLACCFSDIASVAVQWSLLKKLLTGNNRECSMLPIPDLVVLKRIATDLKAVG